jgi:hypothetical protein
VSEARWPVFSSMRATLYPGVDVGTRNALMPRLPASLEVTAKTTATSAVFPDVMNCFTPFSMYWLPLRSARVVIAAASDPTPGSVSAKAPSIFPAANGRRNCSFCCALP